MPPPIIIIKGNTTDNSLILSDGGHTRAEKGNKIEWKITDDPTNVKSIEKIVKKSGDDIFSAEPSKESAKKWKAKIKDSPPNCGIYVYSITWKDESDNPHTYDPIISINPSKKVGISGFIVLILATLLTAFSVKLWQRKQNDR